MSLSKVLESIYTSNVQAGNIAPTPSTAQFGGPDASNNDTPLSAPLDQTPDATPETPFDTSDENDTDPEDCGCPKVELAHSFVQWIKDNVELIHNVLDAVENGDVDVGDDEYGDEDSLDQSNEPSFGMDDKYDDPEARAKEFEEFKAFGIDTDELPTDTGGDLEKSGDDSFGDGAVDPSAQSDIDDLEPDDPDRAGDIRTVQDAHLVFKRKTQDGTFEELWFYNIGDDSARSDDDIKRDILSGTSIDPKKLASEDGKQQYTMWTVGNGQMIHIVGVDA